ncbi:LOW QUALITY PROTEIN: gamma-secretase subunit Aph-1b-like [Falco naumanni]|uniref:LOW QUALITY PROTEIN: gamma-secretase subunit Aph-1b-like n=1 Tax=Falco naumanni TaxID=148594 RepID=UPI001ADEBA4D|nr:LOW QUALITY PROTEIN: gamma-secretase subunit Aph-1b-like [Falco naumanni]
MTLAIFFGCTFIAFGPALGLFLFTIARDPLRIIILIAGAFFWLVLLLLSSLIWFITVKVSDPQDEPLQKGLLIFGVMFSVLLQEAFRFLYYKLLRQAIEGLVALSEDGCSPISIQQMAYVAGVGFGLMSGTFSMINLLADTLGPGTMGIHGDSQLYFLASAFMTMVLIFLHTFWGILFFHGCEHWRWWEITAVVVMHLTVSRLTFCNPLYMGSLVPSYLLMATAATWAYLLSGGSAQNLRHFLLCKFCSIMGTGDPAGSSGYLDQHRGGERVSQRLEQGHHPLWLPD